MKRSIATCVPCVDSDKNKFIYRVTILLPIYVIKMEENMYCKNCGNELYEQASCCPKCGCPTGKGNGAESQEGNKKTNTLAIVGFVLSFFVAIAGLVCSIIARKQIRETGEGGAGLALAGLIISIVSMAIVAIYAVIAVITALLLI